MERPRVGIWHVAIPVADLEKSVTFYCSSLGFKLMGRDEYPSKKQALISVEEGGFAIELFEPTQNKEEKVGSKPDHLAFEVDDLVRFRTYLVEMQRITGVPEIESFDNGVKCFGLKDSDGMSIEFFQGRAFYEAFLASQPKGIANGSH